MNRCMVTTGFFVLGRCGRNPVATCGSCGRPVCDRHVMPDGLCAECATAHGYGRGDPYHPFWARGYRRTQIMGNVTADANGEVHTRLTTHSISLKSGEVTNPIGKAVVLHEKADDLVSQPSGNAGARIACGVIETMTHP